MRIWRSLDDVPSDLGRTVVVIGNFDGVHLGHRHVVQRARELADRDGLRVVAATFDPHPMAVLRPEHAPLTLTDIDRRSLLLAQAGVDDVFVIPFSREIAAWTPVEFIDRVLVNGLHARHVVVGANFRFGARASGDVAALRRGRPASATSTPRASRSTAAHRCGPPPTSAPAWPPVTSRVPPRRSGVPTPSSDASSRATTGAASSATRRPTCRPVGAPRPADGVYAGWLRRPATSRGAEPLPAAISVGTNPTFEGERDRRVEAYVLDRTDLELYGEQVEIAFVSRIRGMVKFEGVDALVETMAQDVVRTRELLADLMRRRPRPTPLAATDAWFLRNGLSYFVPERRAGGPAGAPARRTGPVRRGDRASWRPRRRRSGAARGGVQLRPGDADHDRDPGGPLVRLTALNARADRHAGRCRRPSAACATLLPMMSRALPLLLLFITFLFINAEVWQVTSRPGRRGAVAGRAAVLGARGRLPARPPARGGRPHRRPRRRRLPARRLPGHARWSRCRATWSTTPDCDPAAYAEVKGYEFGNLVMVLVIIQVVQVLLLAVTVFVFFLVFGGLMMTNDVVEAWIGESSHAWRYLPNLTVELVQVSIFLAAFSGLYLTVSTVTDETYRAQFFGRVQQPDGARGGGPGGLPRAAGAAKDMTSDPASA